MIYIKVKVKVKSSRYMPDVTQRMGRGIALLFHDRGTRRGWVVSSTPGPHFTPGKDPVLILQETGWAPGPVWTDGKSRSHRDSILDCPARSSVAIPTELLGPVMIYIASNTVRNMNSCINNNYWQHNGFASPGEKNDFFIYRAIRNDCRGFNNLVLRMQLHVISVYGVTWRIRFMFLVFPQVSRNWRYESEPPFKPSPLTRGTNSIIVLMFVESQRVHI